MAIQAVFEPLNVDAGKLSVNFLLAPLEVQSVEDRLITPDRITVRNLHLKLQENAPELLRLLEEVSPAQSNSFGTWVSAWKSATAQAHLQDVSSAMVSLMGLPSTSTKWIVGDQFVKCPTILELFSPSIDLIHSAGALRSRNPMNQTFNLLGITSTLGAGCI